MRTETFEFPDTAGKWLEGRGLPYAIVEDLSAIPRDVRVDMEVLRDFPPSAVVQNLRARVPVPARETPRERSPRERSGSDPEISLCTVK